MGGVSQLRRTLSQMGCQRYVSSPETAGALLIDTHRSQIERDVAWTLGRAKVYRV
jgi:hypothetical protein